MQILPAGLIAFLCATHTDASQSEHVFNLLSSFKTKQQSLDLFFIQDFSEGFQRIRSEMIKQLDTLTSEVHRRVPAAHQGLAGFVDKPLHDVGRISGDYCYLHRYRLTRYIDRILQSYSVAIPHSGDDWKENQLGALIDAATLKFTGWRNLTLTNGYSVPRVIVMITDSGYHEAGDTHIKRKFNTSGSLDLDAEECTSMDYPSVDQVKEALDSQNVTAVFVVPHEIVPVYQNLVRRLGDRGMVRGVDASYDDFAVQVTKALARVSTGSVGGHYNDHGCDEEGCHKGCSGASCCPNGSCVDSAYKVVLELDHKPKHLKIVVDN